MSVASRSPSAGSWPVRYACWAGAGLVATFALVAAAGPASPHALTSIPRAQLLAVSALSATGARAVGDLDTGGPAGLHTLAVHWNGTGWAQVPGPPEPDISRVPQVQTGQSGRQNRRNQ